MICLTTSIDKIALILILLNFEIILLYFILLTINFSDEELKIIDHKTYCYMIACFILNILNILIIVILNKYF